jgi:hypothetical protein
MLVFMGPVSLVAGGEQMLAFAHIASFVGSREKLGTDSRIDQPTCCELCWEPLFTGAVTLLNSVSDYVKGCHVRGVPVGSVRGAYVYGRGKRTCHVDWVFPCRVYIDSNRYDSRI